ncbi:MATE family efflux transporter [Spartinivicinus ruber]|uniref:MATE family efflux transporter n=1 Tax=Spartinivicinus ruber TaxID=2683272 RepID=UPI0013D62E74|nr:MATE family efflux transporter [Spartinivicinus ruber]
MSSYYSNTNIRQTFLRYTIPSVVAMLVSGLYQIVDGFFIGHFIGYEGLAGINLVWPVICLISAVGVMIGLGCGSLISINRGEGNLVTAKQTLFTGIALLFILGLLTVIVAYYISPIILKIQGTSEQTLLYGMQYAEICTLSAVFSICAAAMPLLIRNLESPKIATGLLIIGAAINIILDYLFIVQWQWGLQGAAIATVIAQLVVMVACLFYFFSSLSSLRLTLESITFSLNKAVKVIKLGLSTLVMYLYISFVVALHNWLFMKYGSPVDVGAFAIVGYLMSLYYLLAEGIAEGIQPPISYYFGANQVNNIENLLKLALKIVTISGIIWLLVLNIFPITIIGVFNDVDIELINKTQNGLRLHLILLFLDGFFVIAAVYFLAINQGAKSLMVSVGNMLVQIPFLILLPQWFGINGIWLALPLSNMVLFLIAAPMLWKDVKGRSKQGQTYALAKS